ncbi:hypothetical protein EDD37DRAFT_357026 [Exophiala viscosa]|uniref:uncharacterized protein n=1 Tax=Exophiala viscosa TaxID=2486360 RepID=UPI00219E52C5|nr:hypothetical protein EDD37DRAFT_357026 [Exophiala viscosa]
MHLLGTMRSLWVHIIPTRSKVQPPIPLESISKPDSLTSQRSNGMAEFDLHGDKVDRRLKLASTMLASCLLFTAICFGSLHLIFDIHATEILGIAIDTDLQFSVLGLINKIMDFLVTVTLQEVAAVILTLWLTDHKLHIFRPGARLADLELADELTKPWVPIMVLLSRWKMGGWDGIKWRGILRFLTTWTVSICVLLQGLAINTVAVPKLRWTDDSPQHYPALRFNNIDLSQWYQGAQMVGSGTTNEMLVANAYSTSIAFQALSTLPQGFNDSNNKNGRSRGLQQIGGKDAGDDVLLILDTRMRGNVIQGTAVHNPFVQNIFDWFHANGTDSARYAVGWDADLKLVVPVVNVSCSPETQTQTALNQTVTVQQAALTSTSFSINVNTPLGHANATQQITNCTLSFSRGLLPVKSWIVSDEPISTSPNNYNTDWNGNVSSLPAEEVDANITLALNQQMSIIMDRFETITQNLSAAELLTTTAAQIRNVATYVDSDEDALAAVLAWVATSSLGYADWDVTMDHPDQMLVANIRWQLYGSSPRLSWEWSTMIILCVLLLSMFTSITIFAMYRISPSQCLRPGGMLVAANLSKELPSLHSSGPADTDVTKKSADETRYWIRSMGGDRISFVDSHSPDQGKATGLRTPYRWGSS